MGTRQLSDEMKKYGYVFSLKKTLGCYLLFVGGMILLGRMFQLQWQYTIALCVVMMMLLPFFIRNAWKNRYEQQRFSDVNIYLEQFLYSFQKSQKVLVTLEDVEGLFIKGSMKRVIHRAREYIANTYHEITPEEKALQMIAVEYPCEQIQTMHHYALQVEALGGDCHHAIMLLLESRRMWSDRIYQLLAEKKKQRFNIILSIITSLLLCSFIFLISNRMEISIAQNPMIQIITTLVLAVDILIFYQADKRFAAGYFDEENSTENMKKLYQRYQNYQKHPWRHRLSIHAAKKRITREIEKVFPSWLMQISLLLQSENVSVAIMKSYTQAPAILKIPLRELIYSMEQEPGTIRPYLKFLQEFTIPEVKSAMKMLYSISEGTGGEADSQITDIIRRNQLLMNKASIQKNQDALAGMYGLFLAPQITGGIKLVADLVIMMVAYIGQMGG